MISLIIFLFKLIKIYNVYIEVLIEYRTAYIELYWKIFDVLDKYIESINWA